MNRHPRADQRRERACAYLREALDNLNKGLGAINNHPEFGEQRDLLLGWALEVGALERNLRSGAPPRVIAPPADRAELAEEVKRRARTALRAAFRAGHNLRTSEAYADEEDEAIVAIDALARSTDAPSEPVGTVFSNDFPPLPKRAELCGGCFAYTAENMLVYAQEYGEGMRRDRDHWRSLAEDRGRTLIESAAIATPPAAATSTPCAAADPHAHWITSPDGLSRRTPAPDASPPMMPDATTHVLVSSVGTSTPPAGNTEDARSVGAVDELSIMHPVRQAGAREAARQFPGEALRRLAFNAGVLWMLKHNRAALTLSTTTGGAAS